MLCIKLVAQHKYLISWNTSGCAYYTISSAHSSLNLARNPSRILAVVLYLYYIINHFSRTYRLLILLSTCTHSPILRTCHMRVFYNLCMQFLFCVQGCPSIFLLYVRKFPNCVHISIQFELQLACNRTDCMHIYIKINVCLACKFYTYS